MEANIAKPSIISSLNNKPLTVGERKRLKRLTTGYAKVKLAAKMAGVDKGTIYNALAGKNLQPDIAIKIRDYLANL